MSETYVVKPNDSLWSISKQSNVSFQELKKANPQLASRIPPYGISPGETVKLPPPQAGGDIGKVCEKCHECIKYNLNKPFLIARARDSAIVPVVNAKISDDVMRGEVVPFGQDLIHGTGRAAPGGQSVGTDEDELRKMMKGLLGEFAAQDFDRKANRLFDLFLRKNNELFVFVDADLDRAATVHPNVVAFSDLTLSAPGTQGINPGRTRIHQALKSAGWDINKVKMIDDLGVPAFNMGSKVFRSGDFGNGLGVMINGVQYVYVYVESYHYDSCGQKYEIKLKFAFYDVFGLDDDDLSEYGASGVVFSTTAGVGITAWWQLQHQFNYAPLLTRAVVFRTFVVSTLE